jgi:basic amino acid/polyamine antiporter, APA family
VAFFYKKSIEKYFFYVYFSTFTKKFKLLNKKIMSDFKRSVGLLDATMLVMGSMIGSGIFIVSASITCGVGSAGGLIAVWVVTGVMMIAAALSFGELSAMYPKAGGLYVYLQEAFGKLPAFLYGWALFTVIQTGTIAAIGVAFGKYAAYVFPFLGEKNILFGLEKGINATTQKMDYFFSISAAQLTSIGMILLLTFINTRGIQNGRWIQLVFTLAKTGGLAILILLGLFVAVDGNIWSNNWATGFEISQLSNANGVITSTPVIGNWATISAIAIASVGAIFSSFAWESITFIAGEIKNPQKNIGLSLFLGVSIVIGIYILTNLMFLRVLPLNEIAFAESERVGVVAANKIWAGWGTKLLAIIVMISTFGCNNGLILSSARVFYTMAKDKLFFKSSGELNRFGVPEKALWLQCIWACLLCLSGRYGDLLDYVIFVVLIFYALSILAIFVLRKKYPNAERPYKAIGYPVVPFLYLVITAMICVPLLVYKPNYTWPGLMIILAGIPVYFLMMKNMEKNPD